MTELEDYVRQLRTLPPPYLEAVYAINGAPAVLVSNLLAHSVFMKSYTAFFDWIATSTPGMEKTASRSTLRIPSRSRRNSPTAISCKTG